MLEVPLSNKEPDMQETKQHLPSTSMILYKGINSKKKNFVLMHKFTIMSTIPPSLIYTHTNSHLWQRFSCPIRFHDTYIYDDVRVIYHQAVTKWTFFKRKNNGAIDCWVSVVYGKMRYIFFFPSLNISLRCKRQKKK